ncbi:MULTISPECIES: cell division protein FtsL [Thiorhodovibrio]|uniref:cell division protein FtsL n=1 Tax=Thiorhodovibrio TaxID=61593 RepID=UPI001912B492|nr:MULTISPECIES: cell division protein FtsL [Thiorhodovibrio]MBK5968237.1 cell division protein FtsL [Thiorhodovibrio winogradskyi]WPL14791.1 Cell division protein FtsL [Thiorhodovibrio litoralis]
MTRPRLIGFALLAFAVIASAVSVAYVKFLTRAEFVRLQEARTERDALDVEWGRLRLEEASLIAHSRLEDRARQELGMHLPQAAEVRVLEVVTHGN